MAVRDPWSAQIKVEGSFIFDATAPKPSKSSEPVEYLELRCTEKDLRLILKITRQEQRQFFQDLRVQCRDALRRMKKNDIR